MTTILATYYAKIQDVPDSEYKVEILEDGPVKKVAVNEKVYDVDYNVGVTLSIPLSSIIIRTEYRYLRLPIPLIPL